MSAGTLTKRVEFQELRDESDFDFASDEWVTVFRTRAEIVPNSSSQVTIDEQTEEMTSHTIRIRYDRRFHPLMRCKLGERVFAIEGSINEDEANEYWRLSANELTG